MNLLLLSRHLPLPDCVNRTYHSSYCSKNVKETKMLKKLSSGVIIIRKFLLLEAAVLKPYGILRRMVTHVVVSDPGLYCVLLIQYLLGTLPGSKTHLYKS